MIREFAKTSIVVLSPHFQLRELDCKCRRPTCTTTYVDTDLVAALEQLRALIGRLTISSAFRCTAHNKEIGGKPGSYHLLGKAADINAAISPKEVHKVAETLPAFINGGLGLYTDFVHVDVRGYKARWGIK